VEENFNSSVLKTVGGRLSTAHGMRRSSFQSFRWGILPIVVLITFLGGCPLQAQEHVDAPKPVPVIIGGSGFITTFDGGEPHLGPLIAPVVLVPMGNRWLIESRTTFESDLTQRPGSSAFHGKVLKNVDYLQLDFIANPYMTVTAGRFLTPFGIFNERLYPIWIRNLQTDPLILPIAVGPSGASTGAMVRGGFQATSGFNVNYAAYFSALSTIGSGSATSLESDRSAGGRLGIFILNARLELGGSFQHLLQNERSNSFGFHGGWQPPSLPLEFRGEYERSIRGSGYWIEIQDWRTARMRTGRAPNIHQASIIWFLTA